MNATDRSKAFDAARSLEQAGDLDGAARGYAQAGAADDVVRVLAKGGRHAEAVRYALAAVRVPTSQMSTLDPAGRKLALRAATSLAQLGDKVRAAEIYAALGDTQSASRLLEQAGPVASSQIRASTPPPGSVRTSTPLPALARTMTVREPPAATGPSAGLTLEQAGNLEQALRSYLLNKQFGDAGRIARKMGKPAEAAKLYVDADMPFEAAVCYFEARDAGRCLEQLVRVPKEHERYRSACTQAIRIAYDRDTLSFQLDRLLSKFLESGPQNEKELEAFYAAARLYQRHGQPDVAIDALEKILAVDPRFRDAASALDTLRRKSTGAIEKIKEEDEAFHRAGRPRTPLELPDLPPLPELTGPPPPVSTAAPPRSHATAVVPTAQAEARARASVTADSPDPKRLTADELTAGTIVANRYELESKIGQGGMAVVYRARDLELGEVVALKIFMPMKETPEMLTRFKQELLLSRQLTHPNIVRLYDIGMHEGSRFISMELLAGRDLGDIIARQHGPLEVIRAVRYLVQACAGLYACHERGIVHRDIKPDNFFVTSDEVVKLMDFGIAKRQNTVGVTQTNFLAGTPAYIAPEQITGFTTVTHLADIYSLGIVAFELLTGTIPFDAPETMPLLMKHLNAPPPSVSDYNPRVPPELDRVVLRLLEKDPASRYQSCKELARALSEIGQRLAAARGA